MRKLNTSLAFISGFLVSIHSAYAIHSTIVDAEALRNRIIAHEANLKGGEVDRSIVLPVSRGFDQKQTCLCWSYAFFNALETLYLIDHPQSQLEISRGAMQYLNIQDRFDLTILGVEDHINPQRYKRCGAEGGTPLSAEYLMRNYGAVTYDNYHDVITPPDYSTIYYATFAENTSIKWKKSTASLLLADYFGDEIPEQVNFNGQWLSPLEFAQAILPKGNWVTYSISKDGSDYIGPGRDPDRRRNEQTHYISQDNLLNKLTWSLQNKHPILYSNDHHVVMIYGADFDRDDHILSFYIKDNYERLGYFYKADFDKAMREMTEVTILE